MIEVKDLSFTYAGGNKPALSNIDFTLERGKIMTVVGKSGSGKTTLLRLLKEEIAPHGTVSGSIKIKNKNRFFSAYVFQNPETQTVTHTVENEIAFGLENMGFDSSLIALRVAETAAFFGLERIIDAPTDSLSFGQKQLVALAASAAMKPELLILDEPTAMLDPTAESAFINMTEKLNREFGVTIIIGEHELGGLLHLTDKLLALESGRAVFCGSPREITKERSANDEFLNKIMPSPVVFHRLLNPGEVSPLTVAESKNELSRIIGENPVYNRIEETEEGKENKNCAVEVKNLYFGYGEQYIINNLSLKIPEGSVFGLMGANGSGKSTLLNLMASTLKGDRGKIKINVKKGDGHGVVMMPQNPESLFSQNTIGEELKLFAKERKVPEEVLKEITEFCEIEGLLDRHPYDVSGGEMQKTALALVLMTQSPVILLDEPTKGMDKVFRERFALKMRKLASEGKTVVTVTHDVDFCAEYCDECALIFKGKIVSCGTKREFFKNNIFFTTDAEKITDGIFENTVTDKEVLSLCRKNMQV